MTKFARKAAGIAMLGLACVASLNASALKASAAADDARTEMSASFVPPQSSSSSSDFSAEFDSIIADAGPATGEDAITVPAHAVDLSTFEPPRGPSVLRDLGAGVASFYGRRFHGRLTANGERFDMNAMTAAHKTLPFGTRVRVTNARNGRSVVVRINDRGPFIKGRTIDLSRAAAKRLGFVSRGHARVELDIIE